MLIHSEISKHLRDLSRLAPDGYFIGLHIRFAAPIMQFQTYPKEWIDYYTQQGYALRDPTIAWGFSMEGACRWSEFNLPDPFHILAEAKTFGLNYGVTVSCGKIASRTIASFTLHDREFREDEIAQISDLVRRLHDITEPPQELTKAQIEALRCVAAGDRHAAAAAKLGITQSAFKARLLSARERLMARTTAEAIQRAKEYRLL
ncbi:LuxR family transcriptional regulator [Rhodobacter sp. JA431]|uniref:autoinducer binding domain-containing protein n=1 Tax=Rhodobacter sp. JA431 TaxID=570013 RepID=UPI000BD6A0C2|nr:autoinducer binding domain-containing protein [Rhodobacter sp. JA431]SOC17710.1 LuxR family transcriptional regulator [Rhodobacter sp. JA431]